MRARPASTEAHAPPVASLTSLARHAPGARVESDPKRAPDASRTRALPSAARHPRRARTAGTPPTARWTMNRMFSRARGDRDAHAGEDGDRTSGTGTALRLADRMITVGAPDVSARSLGGRATVDIPTVRPGSVRRRLCRSASRLGGSRPSGASCRCLRGPARRSRPSIAPPQRPASVESRRAHAPGCRVRFAVSPLARTMATTGARLHRWVGGVTARSRRARTSATRTRTTSKAETVLELDQLTIAGRDDANDRVEEELVGEVHVAHCAVGGVAVTVGAGRSQWSPPGGISTDRRRTPAGGSRVR